MGVVSCSPDGTSAVVGTSNGLGGSSLLLYDVRTMTLGRNSPSYLSTYYIYTTFFPVYLYIRHSCEVSGVGNFKNYNRS